jgi:hypothetical protein
MEKDFDGEYIRHHSRLVGILNEKGASAAIEDAAAQLAQSTCVIDSQTRVIESLKVRAVADRAFIAGLQDTAAHLHKSLEHNEVVVKQLEARSTALLELLAKSSNNEFVAVVKAVLRDDPGGGDTDGECEES